MDEKAQDKTVHFGQTNKTIIAGLVICGFLVTGIGTWAATAELSSAVVVNGQVMVSSDVKVVQNPDGGVVTSINVKDGDAVKAGDILLTLDASLLQKTRSAADSQLISVESQLARLTAERDGSDTLAPDADLQSRADDPAVKDALETEAKVMAANKAAREGQIESYKKQISEIKDKIKGLETQRDAKTTSIDLIQDELKGVQKLYEKGYVPKTRITAMKRDLATLEGERGSLVSQIAVANGQIEETELNIAQVTKSFQQETQSQIAADMPRVGSLTQQRDAADVKLSRVEVRAPSDGIVNKLAVHTVSAVVQPGQTLMEIVPQDESLVVTTRVPAKDITHVKVGQDAQVMISSFDRNTTPRLDGKVSYVSADLAANAQQNSPGQGSTQTAAASYEVRIALDDVKANHPNLQFMPGMQAQVFISAGRRTMAQYLAEPVMKRLDNTFREF